MFDNLTSSMMLNTPSSNRSTDKDEPSLESLIEIEFETLMEISPRERRQLWPIIEGIGQKIYNGWHSGHIGDFLKTTKSLFGSSTSQMLENNGHDAAFVEKSKSTFELLQTMFMGEMKNTQKSMEAIMSTLSQTESAESDTISYISILIIACLSIGGVILFSIWVMFIYCKSK
jgi:hypothetical protein